MTKYTDIADEAKRYCKMHNIALSTLGLRALGNGRYFDRLERKRRDEEQAEIKLRDYIAANPAPQSEGAGT